MREEAAVTQDLLEVVVDGVAVLTLNRPDRLNAMSGSMLDGLLEALPRLAEDGAVGVIVLTGAGRGFCAGGDVKAMAEGTRWSGTTWRSAPAAAHPHGGLALAPRDAEAHHRHGGGCRGGSGLVAGAGLRSEDGGGERALRAPRSRAWATPATSAGATS